jgi:double-stranded uracil-DNA glycosylase
VLVLGSMPGPASLRAQQYYAHPQNLFWPIVGAACGFDASLPYANRCAALGEAGIALWDVLGSCRRVGAADSSIALADAVANDLPGFLRGHARVARVLFNGALAGKVWRQRFGAQLAAGHPQLELIRLPSTSAANAAMGRAQRQQAWQAALVR